MFGYVISPVCFTINFRNYKDRLCSLCIYQHLDGTYCLHFPTLKMEGASSSETLVNIYNIIRHRILDDKNFHTSLVFILLKAKMFTHFPKFTWITAIDTTNTYIFASGIFLFNFRQKRLPYNLLIFLRIYHFTELYNSAFIEVSVASALEINVQRRNGLIFHDQRSVGVANRMSASHVMPRGRR